MLKIIKENNNLNNIIPELYFLYDKNSKYLMVARYPSKKDRYYDDDVYVDTVLSSKEASKYKTRNGAYKWYNFIQYGMAEYDPVILTLEDVLSENVEIKTDISELKKKYL